MEKKLKKIGYVKLRHYKQPTITFPAAMTYDYDFSRIRGFDVFIDGEDNLILIGDKREVE